MPVNERVRPVPLPAGVTLEAVREDLLRLGAAGRLVIGGRAGPGKRCAAGNGWLICP